MMIEKEFVNDLDRLGVELADNVDMNKTLKILEMVCATTSVKVELNVLPIEGVNSLVLIDLLNTVNNWYVICDVVYKNKPKEITLEQLEFMLLGKTINGLKLSKETLDFYNENKITADDEINVHNLIELSHGYNVKGVYLSPKAREILSNRI